MLQFLILSLSVAFVVYLFAGRRQEDVSRTAGEFKDRALVEWQRVRARGTEDYEDLKAELVEERELQRLAAARAAANARDKPL